MSFELLTFSTFGDIRRSHSSSDDLSDRSLAGGIVDAEAAAAAMPVAYNLAFELRGLADCVGVGSLDRFPLRLFCDAVDIGLLSEISLDFDFFRSLSLSRSLFLSFFLCLCLRCSSLSACDRFRDSVVLDVAVAVVVVVVDAEDDAFAADTLLFDGIISL